MFEIRVDRVNLMLVATGTGFWTLDTARAYLDAEREAIASLGAHVQDISILFDARNLAVQSQEVIALLRDPTHPLWNAKRGAFVSPPGLGALQIKRGTADTRVRIFDNDADALRFLLDTEGRN